ncbi:topology modulation protein [Halobacillus sp. BBL2006]|uniref:topology modulation protein n=1 Tax=Halobacillus sp. BBL2006 TaxID=1543706 RepID=UPI0005425967|nr:topology modulation protein [Halobacillus sp. BBL2006]KHE67872.1 topology modulation protein [Halobacillus sp. BBL2006]
MKRIMVMGVSAGAGKSTFARRLGEKLGINVYHLDRFFWEPGWKQASLEDFKRRQQDVTVQDEWILEGNYSITYDLRTQRADTIVYLEAPLMVCLYRVVKRWFLNRGKTRVDMGEDCTEKLDFEFIKFIVTTYHSRKKKMRIRFQEFQMLDPENRVIVLKDRKTIKSFLNHLPNNK